jgi:putative DNA primase/helicase
VSNFPDFSQYCEKACRKLWGEPTRATKKELIWNSDGDDYSGRTFNKAKNIWFDRGANVGGSTLELVAYSNGGLNGKLRGERFFEVWRKAAALGIVPEAPPEKNETLAIRNTYLYSDETGEQLFEVVRFDTEDKGRRFRERRPDGKGGWIWGTKGVRRILYRLPELIEGISNDQPALVCEGEHDVETARELGYVATTPPGGAEKPWFNEYSATLRGADVIVVSDNDANDRGQRHADKIARELTGVAQRVRVIMFPVKDLSEWIAAGHTREELDALIEAAPDYVARDVLQVSSEPKAAGEDAIALRFAEQHVADLRYVAAWGRWLEWNGKNWRFDDTLRAFDLARRICREADESDAKVVAAVERLAKSDRRLAATIDQWDADPWLLNTPNGVVDLRTGNMCAARPEDYCTKITAVAPSGDCPLWLSFLQRVTGKNYELIAFLQRMCGYALTGVTREHALFFGYGTGANGKSVFVETIASILNDYHCSAPIETFAASNVDRHPTELADLRGARLVTSVETEEGRRWAESRIKMLTGGDRVKARFMRQDFFEFVPQLKLFIIGNHKPSLRSVDEAMRRRFNLIPFAVTIPVEERDAELPEKLKAESTGILAWMIQGCLRWKDVGLRAPEIVTAATAKYLEAVSAGAKIPQ